MGHTHHKARPGLSAALCIRSTSRTAATIHTYQGGCQTYAHSRTGCVPHIFKCCGTLTDTVQSAQSRIPFLLRLLLLDPMELAWSRQSRVKAREHCVAHQCCKTNAEDLSKWPALNVVPSRTTYANLFSSSFFALRLFPCNTKTPSGNSSDRDYASS